MNPHIRPLDTVARTANQPEHGLACGQVGTVAGELAPGVFEVESIDDGGQTYASVSAREDLLMVLHYRSQKVA